MSRPKCTFVRVQSKLLRDYKRNAKKRDLEWNLSATEFEDLAKSRCTYCGKSAGRRKLWREGEPVVSFERLNGVDRADSTKGYTPDNCVPCCTTCNRFKSKMSQKEFIRHVRRISNHKSRK